MDLGRCLCTSLDVRPGQVASMDLQPISKAGINQPLFRNCTRAGSVFMWYKLLEKTYDWRGLWAALVSADTADWNIVSRGEGFEVGYPCR